MFTTQETFDSLVGRYGEESLLTAYGFPINVNISSPIRPGEDDNPSFRFKFFEDRIYWKDYALPTKPQSLIEFFKIIEQTENEFELVKKICARLKTNDIHPLAQLEIRRHTTITHCGAQFKRIWKPWEKTFWEQGDMDQLFLMTNAVFPLHELRMNGMKVWESRENNPKYLYVIHQKDNSFQAYAPYNPKGNRHRSWNLNRLMGLNQLDTSKPAILTSSYKDVLTIRKAGYQSLCMPAETWYLPQTALNKLLTKIPKLGVMLNNDVPGRKAQKYYTDNGCIGIKIPLNYPKDPWDIIIKYNYSELKCLITNYF